MKMLRNLVLVTHKSEERKASNEPFKIRESSNDSGIVVSFGPDVKDIKAGQRIYFLTKYQNTYIKGENFLVMEDDNIFAVEK